MNLELTDLKKLKTEIETLKDRNQRVEKDKAWELSWARRICIFILTYIAIVLFFVFAGFSKPFLNSIVPALAFILSTSTIKFLKKYWIKYIYKK